MKEVKVDIIGSCVTRDAFEILKELKTNNCYVVNNYISKVSIISLVSRKLKFKYKINSKKISTWENRQVQYDLQKNWIEVLRKSDSDVIIVDLIDERYDLYKIQDSYITKSNIIKNAKFKPVNGVKFQVIKRNYKESISLWEESLDIFINELKQLNKPIILHKAYWKKEYINNKVNKSINKKFYIKNIIYSFYYKSLIKKTTFNNRFIRMANIQNDLLDHYYNKIEEYKGINSILIKSNYKADNGHRWGLAPFHYEKQYYIEFINMFDMLFKNIDK